MSKRKVIITCAITGSSHTPSMSPYLPCTPDEIAESAIEASQAGAAVLHLHARDPENGKPTPAPEVFQQFLPRIKANCDSVINISTGASSQMTVEQRMAAALQSEPEMCSLNMGSMNFGIFPMKDKYSEWKYDWEPDFLQGTHSSVFRNTFADIEAVFASLGRQRGAKFEFECYDSGHIQTVAHYIRQKRIQAPVFLQFVLGILGGADACPEQLLHMKATADRLLGDQYQFSVLAAGRHQITLGTMNVILGGHVRVGLEDSLTIGRGELATSNAQQVTKMRAIVEALGFAVATPEDVRQMLSLKGPDQVNF